MDKIIDNEVYIKVDADDKGTISLLKKHFERYDIVEEDHFIGEGVVIFIVSISYLFANSKVLKTVIEKLFDQEKIEIEYEGIKISGSYEHVQTILKELLEEKRRKKK